MSDIRDAADERTWIENLTDELTSALYRLMLRRGLRGSWVKLELALWKALAEAVERWAREARRSAPPGEFDARREGFLSDLTCRALSVAAEHVVEGALPELERGVGRASRTVLGRRGRG